MSGYVGVKPVPRASRVIATGVLESESNTIKVAGGFTPKNISVYLNGVRLRPTDFNDSDGENVIFFSPVPAGTEWMIEQFRSFELPANGVPEKMSDLNNDMWEVTDTVPTSGDGKPAGYIWFIV